MPELWEYQAMLREDTAVIKIREGKEISGCYRELEGATSKLAEDPRNKSKTPILTGRKEI